MDQICFILIVTLCIVALLIKFLFYLEPKSKLPLPPGLPGVPIISTLKWLGKSLTEMETTLVSLHSKLGPIIGVPIGSMLFVFISDHALAHQALVQKGAIFADRPNISPITKQLNITLAGYGPTWRALRRNLTSHILHPSRIKEYSRTRKWVLELLFTRLGSAGDSPVVKVVDHFQFALFSLLVHMCFGCKLDESKVREIEAIQRELLVSSTEFQVLNFWPRLTRVVLSKSWKKLIRLRKKQQEVLIPLIRARNRDTIIKDDTCYADTLLSLEVEDGTGSKRKLTEEELIGACSELLSAGTDTTMTTLQWIMANLVKHPEFQSNLFDEIRGVVISTSAEQVEEEDLPKMPYLKAVVLEGLRRHPPSHFVLPHTVTRDDVELGGYLVPKNAVINFAVAQMGWDPKVWENPMEFKPERFMPEFDISSSREIKMMPFGAGRRICPGLGLAILHLQYFVANLVWKFRWEVAEGQEVDLSEKQEFTIVMKNPLHACIFRRNVS